MSATEQAVADSEYARRLRKKYGYSLAEYNTQLQQQNYACAICHQADVRAGKSVKLAVDHDHATGKIRGLLCSRCNTTLGAAEDSAALLYAAADYLEKHGVYDVRPNPD